MLTKISSYPEHGELYNNVSFTGMESHKETCKDECSSKRDVGTHLNHTAEATLSQYCPAREDFNKELLKIYYAAASTSISGVGSTGSTS